MKKISVLFQVVAVLLAFSTVAAEEIASGYMMPPKALADLVDAPYSPRVSVSPNNEWIALMPYPGLPPLEDLAQPELRLAGQRINPRTSGPSRGWYYNNLSLMKISDGKEIPISGLPDKIHITNTAWSPDSKYLAFTQTNHDNIELWLVDIEKAAARKLSNLPINDTYTAPFEWLSDSKTLIVLTVPDGRGDPPPEPLVPAGPIIQENMGRKAPARTYQDLLKNEYDEQLYEYYFTSQIVKMTLDGKSTKLGEPGIVRSISPSPDGKYLLTQIIHRPFSYTLPANLFPCRVDVRDIDGNIVYEAVDQPLADMIPVAFGSVSTGRREFGWRSDADAALYWVEAQDGGDAAAEAEIRDKVFLLSTPFDAEPTELASLGLRFSDVHWGSDDLAIVTEWWWQTRKIHAWRIKPDKPGGEPELLLDYSWEDRYNDPGRPVFKRTDRGTLVLLTADKGRSLFLSGNGASPEGDRPFLDKFDLKTKKTERLFRSEAPFYESVVRVLDAGKGLVMTSREAVDQPPNYFIRNLKKDKTTQLTFFPHPTPQLTKVQKELIAYQRADGVTLNGTLYLPEGYSPEKDGPLPVLMWAYPEEFKSADAAGQVTGSPYEFIRVHRHSPLLWLVHGYAVLDDPSMPIIGEGKEEPNDTYVEQLVASAQAAVDELVRRGVADPDKVAIGGHSYGAFMTANLLAHSDIFRTGLARSGAYNRTLTPFGFQSEERTLWQAPEVYFAMSPFMHADKINEPLLMIHGEADDNAGTFPMQSERLYDALKGLGATVRLVMLPHESHGYMARESVMHMLWETTEWLDRYVKNAEPREKKE
ncbi:MAG: prolyl oligopeptidase family serine peptidase [candidate division Zixibacteria bacterium]|nr:prolyl oligopeptidase family serine peptidase [candidate division Zixibacteria bacterium]